MINRMIRKSFPSDYDFGAVNPKYVVGMSVPPVMIAQVASEIYKQCRNAFD